MDRENFPRISGKRKGRSCRVNFPRNVARVGSGNSDSSRVVAWVHDGYTVAISAVIYVKYQKRKTKGGGGKVFQTRYISRDLVRKSKGNPMFKLVYSGR